MLHTAQQYLRKLLPAGVKIPIIMENFPFVALSSENISMGMENLSRVKILLYANQTLLSLPCSNKKTLPPKREHLFC